MGFPGMGMGQIPEACLKGGGDGVWGGMMG